jgi:hypothetical protein
MKASAIRHRKIRQPKIQTSSRGLRYEPYSSPRNMCRYTTTKNAEAPVECM